MYQILSSQSRIYTMLTTHLCHVVCPVLSSSHCADLLSSCAFHRTSRLHIHHSNDYRLFYASWLRNIFLIFIFDGVRGEYSRPKPAGSAFDGTS